MTLRRVIGKILPQKSCYRQCCIPSTLKDKIVKFLVVLKSSKKSTYENNLLKILEIRQIQFFLFHPSFLLELLLVPGSEYFWWPCFQRWKLFWVVNTFFLNKPRRAKWWNFQKSLCLHNFHFLAIWKWMFSRNCHSCQSNNVCSHIWNKLHWKLLQSPD